MNSGTLPGFGRTRLAKPTESAQTLTGSGVWSGTAVNIATSIAAGSGPKRPLASVGRDGEWAILFYDGGAGNPTEAKLTGPKAAGAWPTNGTAFGGEATITLPYRSLSQRSADVIPGWDLKFDPSWATGTVPTDLTRTAAFASSEWNSTASGTTIGLSRRRTTSSAPMAFFSSYIKVTTLPEAGYACWVGQIIYAGGANIYGYGAKVESTGAVSLVIREFGGAEVVLDSGLTIAANDWLIVERFANRISAYKSDSTGVPLISADDATSTKRPLNGLAGEAQIAIGNDVYASAQAAASFGYVTDSASIRVGYLGFAG